jgi:protein TonB
MTMPTRDRVASATAVACILALAYGGWLQAEDVTVRISESDARKAAIKRVEPEYPAMARQVRLSGQVQVDVLIGPNGLVEKCTVLKGNVLLSNSAVSALKKWKFAPFSSEGQPTKAITVITFEFRL